MSLPALPISLPPKQRRAAPLCFAEFLWLWAESEGLDLPAHHARIAGWLSQHWQKGTGALLLMAFRGAGKSTIAGLFILWLLWQDRALRIMVIAAEQDLANKMVRNVRRLLQSHPLTKPLIPARREEWASDRLTINRQTSFRDPSLLARGLMGNLTGTRADVIILDDVEVPNLANSRESRRALRERLSEVDYILTPSGLQLYMGTPHSYHSIYGDKALPEEGEDAPFLKGFHRLRLPILTAGGKSRWPERFSEQKINQLRQRHGPLKFASQMMLETISPHKMRLDPALLKAYHETGQLKHANGTSQLWIGQDRILSASCWWDPAFGVAGGDRSAVAIIYHGQSGKYYVPYLEYLPFVIQNTINNNLIGGDLNNQNEQLDPARQQCRRLVDLSKAYHLPAIHVEANGIGRFLPDLLRHELDRHGLGVAVITHISRKSKANRILEAIDAPLAAGQIHCHDSVLAGPLVREMREWNPILIAGNDDGLDALAGALSVEPARLPRQLHTSARQRPGQWRSPLQKPRPAHFNPLS